MVWKILNNIKSGYHHNRRSSKINISKKDFNIIKIFINLNIIKKIVLIEKEVYLIEYNYVDNKKNFLIKNIYKPSNKKIIKLKEIKKTFYRKNNILILSTSNGILTTNEAIKKKTGGVILSKVWL